MNHPFAMWSANTPALLCLTTPAINETLYLAQMLSSNYLDIRHILLFNYSAMGAPVALPHATPSAPINTLKASSLILAHQGT